jgi:predicted phage terminase large subunit-like protein
MPSRPRQPPSDAGPGVARTLNEWAEHALDPLGQKPAAHHRLLLAELEALSRGEADRLMVLMPPGSAKSTYASMLFPAWWFTQHPESNVIAASHTADLAEHFGRQVRNTIVEHAADLGYGVASDNRAAARWQTTGRGTYFAAGVRGPITGRRADLAIIDDPVKSYAEADSPTFRENVWNWFRADLMTRLKPGGRIVLIMTRWHEDDLGGRLLAQNPGEWRLLRLPALAEADDPLGRAEGAPLWPDWEDAAALARKREGVGDRVWSALFQQTPRPPAGSLFRVNDIAVLDEVPASSGAVVRAWDLAATAETGSNDPDWTVGLKLQRDLAGRFVVLDVIRLRGSFAAVLAAIARAAELDGKAVTIGIPEDPGAGGKNSVSAISAMLAGYRIASSRESGSKIGRANPVAAQAETGNLAILRASWNQNFLEELRDFPHGRKDDQVDALSRAFSMLLGAAASPARRLTVPLLAR